MEVEYKLTYYDMTGRAEPIRYMFAIAGVPYDDIRIPNDQTTHPILPPEIKNKLPWGQIPVLEFKGKTLAQSSTIARFVARKFNLTGSDEFEAAKCDELVDAISEFWDGWRPFMRERDPEKQKELLQNIKETLIPKYFGQLNTVLVENGGKWFVGSSVTWADLIFAHSVKMMSGHKKIEIAAGYPALENLVQSVHEIPQIKEWIEKRPKTAV